MYEWLGRGAVCATPAFFALGANGSFPANREDATKLTSIIPLSNPHTRTAGFQGTRIRMAEPPGTKSGEPTFIIILRKTDWFFVEIRARESEIVSTPSLAVASLEGRHLDRRQRD